MRLRILWILLLTTDLVVVSASRLIKELYCGYQSCYDVLSVQRNDSRGVISKAYRKLARTHHPDVASNDEERKQLTIAFRKITTAYETLRDEGVRQDYNEYLDNPSAYYRTYYRYYRRRLTPQVDVRVVIAVSLLVASGIHYYVQCSTYEQTITNLLNIPKLKKQVVDIAKDQGVFEPGRREKRMIDRSELKQRQHKILRDIMAKEVGSDRLTQPSIQRTFVIRLLMLPLTLLRYIYWHIEWQVNHRLLNAPLSSEEKLYLIRSFMGMSESSFRLQYGKTGCAQLIDLELWNRDKFDEWKRACDEETEKQRATSGRYKRFERWSRKNANNQITFDAD